MYQSEILKNHGKALLHFFQPFDAPTSVSLLIPLQTVLPASLLRSFIFCNPSTLQPRSHCSSPCKLSWSEPQRPLLSADLRLLTFFHLLDSVSSIPFGFPAFPSCNFFLLPCFPPFSSMPHLFFTPFLHFPLRFFPAFFLPFLRDLGGIEPYRHHGTCPF